MDAATLRARGDRVLAEQLLADRLVKRVVERVREHDAESPLGVRRRLLATALRLSPAMAPDLHTMVGRCRERLGIDIPLELYVYSSAEFNAGCVRPEAGRLFIMVSSSLLEAFRGKELEFVMGHELAHHLYGHHEIPIGHILKGSERPSPELALKLFSWSRYAEISADRAGAYCAEDMDAVAGALFRLASGLRTDVVKVDLAALTRQVDDYALELSTPDQRTDMSDWFSTHPFSPLRVKALSHYAASELATPGGTSVADLEAHVALVMALMEPSYLDEKTDTAELMRRTLFSGAIAVADADGTISDAEIAVFEKFFGQRTFTERLDVAAIQEDLERRLREVNERVPPPRRVQIVRDLCIVVRADGLINARGREVLIDIARALDVPEAIIDQTCSASHEPD